MTGHGGAALQALAEERLGILGAARPQIRAQQRLLEDVALGPAASDAHDLLEDRLDEADGLAIVTAGVGRHALGDVGDHGPGGLASFTLHLPQLGEPALDPRVVARRRQGHDDVGLGKGRARSRKGPSGKVPDLAPGKRGGANAPELAAPQERAAVRHRPRGRGARDAGTDAVLVDGERARAAPRPQLEKREMPGEMAMQLGGTLVPGDPAVHEVGAPDTVAFLIEDVREGMGRVRVARPESERPLDLAPALVRAARLRAGEAV